MVFWNLAKRFGKKGIAIQIVPLIVCSLWLFTAPLCRAGNSEMLITMISQDIKQESDHSKKSTLHIYRARQYCKINKLKEALDDYTKALDLDHKGWIHLERSQLLMIMEEYELAYEDANAAKVEVPTLAPEAEKIIAEAVAIVRKRYEEENPETIIMNTPVDQYRRTRFDVMREQGLFAAKSGNYSSSSSKKSTKKTQKKTASKSSCRKRGGG